MCSDNDRYKLPAWRRPCWALWPGVVFLFGFFPLSTIPSFFSSFLFFLIPQQQSYNMPETFLPPWRTDTWRFNPQQTPGTTWTPFFRICLDHQQQLVFRRSRNASPLSSTSNPAALSSAKVLPASCIFAGPRGSSWTVSSRPQYCQGQLCRQSCW